MPPFDDAWPAFLNRHDDHDKGSSWSVQAGFNSNAVGGVLKGASVSGHVAEYERDQETRPTRSSGSAARSSRLSQRSNSPGRR